MVEVRARGAVMFCAKCGSQIADGVVYCSSCGGAQPPAHDAAAGRLQECPACHRPNWHEARQCYACGQHFGGPAGGSAPIPVSQASIGTGLALHDASASLPAYVRQQLLPNEPAFAYVSNAGGCNSAKTSLLVTDSRVILKGIDVTKPGQGGCAGAPTSVEIPLDHVSSVAEEKVGSGCGANSGLAIGSGSARLAVRAGGKELEGAARILQALIRARSGRR